MARYVPGREDEALAVLLLPEMLDDFAFGPHARELLSIPRVIALEPSRVRTPRVLREATAMRQARRLRLPGLLRLLVLYHPAQYPLARALCSQNEQAELWYVPPGPEVLESADSAESAELPGALSSAQVTPSPASEYQTALPRKSSPHRTQCPSSGIQPISRFIHSAK